MLARADDDYAGFRDWLAAAAAANGCAIHAYVRKTNHAPAGDAARRGARAPGRPTAEGTAVKAQSGPAAIKSTLTPFIRTHGSTARGHSFWCPESVDHRTKNAAAPFVLKR
jgi:hypothetical protein